MLHLNDNAATNSHNPPVEPEWCGVCKTPFATFKALHVHKLRAKDHFCCPVCSRDFHTKEAVKRHYNLNHATAQSLDCPGCSEKFNRVGGLVCHIEMDMCRVISAEKFGKVRQDKTKWHSDQRNAQVFAHYGAGYEGMAQDTKVGDAGDVARIPPHTTPATPATPGTGARDMWGDESSDSHGVVRLDVEEDLLIFESPKKRDGWGGDNEDKPQMQPFRPPPTREDFSQAFADHWDRSQRKTTVTTSKNSPSLPLQNPAAAEIPDNKGKENLAWTTKYDHEKRFAPETYRTNQPLQTSTWATTPVANPVRPLTDRMESMTVQDPRISEPSNSQKPNDDKWMEYDPDNPKFKVEHYFVTFTRKYKCPHTGCKKSFESPKAFIQHLKSPAHMDSQLQCLNCLRYFGSATALTQHSESQADRCRIRETTHYSAALDMVTAGIAAPAGRHADDTIRYVANPIGGTGGGLQHFIQNHQVAKAAHDEKWDKFWERRIPEW